MPNLPLKYFMLLALLSLACICSSCASLIDTLLGINECAAPGCIADCTKNSIYCAHHDPDLVYRNTNQSMNQLQKRTNIQKH